MLAPFQSHAVVTHAALSLCLVLWASPGQSATYAVGSGVGCTHADLQSALNTASANPSGPHLIKLSTGTLAVPNGLTLHNPQANVRIVGGHTSCTATAPTAGARTVLDASGGANGTVLDIRYFASPWREVYLERLDITGGTGETGIGAASEGAGLELRGNLEVFLDHGTRVHGNRAARGAGVLLQGGPGFARLQLRGGSQIRNNVAETDGGGVWCWDNGQVSLFDSSISFNEAGRDGGGVWLNSGCALSMNSSSGRVAEMNGNRAGTVFNAAGQGRGGAVFLRSARQVVYGDEISIGNSLLESGSLLMIGNEALGAASFSGLGTGGSALYLEGSGSDRIRVQLTDAVLANNITASALGPAAISVNRAIDLRISGSPKRCDGSFGFGLCSVIAGTNGTAIEVNGMDGSTEAIAPRVTVSRTRVTDGGPVLWESYLSNPHTRISFNSSIIDNNAWPHLFEAKSQLSLNFSTVIDNLVGNAGVLWLRPRSGRTANVDLTGSLIWQPGADLINSAGSSGTLQISHGGCLLAHSSAGLPTPATVRTSAPLLASDWTPLPGSPALDVCDRFIGTGGVDAYGQSRPVDQPDTPNFLGAHDLGAIERPRVALPVQLFANGFE